MNYKVLIVLLAAVGLSGCLHDDDGNDVSPDNLSGTWIQPCNTSEYNDASDSQLVINGAEWLSQTTIYHDSECLEPFFTVRMEQISIAGEEVTLSSGTLATEVERTTTGVFMTPETSLDATSFNSGQFCGIATWAVDKEEDITSCTGFFSFTIGEARYDIYKVENNRLYHGKHDAPDRGDTPETRPTSLDYEDVYQRQ